MNKQYVRGIESIPGEARGGVLTIGNFDGVHMGHQRILMTCRAVSRDPTAPVSVIVFDPLPEALLHATSVAPPLIYQVERNCEILMHNGADLVVVIPTTRELLSLSPQEFVEQVVSRLEPRHMVEGSDFFFGRGRSGSVVTLEQLGVKHGYDVTVVDPVVLNLPEGERRVSSTLIRSLIMDGRVEDANYCLGREFAVRGQVVAGHGRGLSLGFPTANVQISGQVVPGNGIYAARGTIAGKSHLAAVSVGNNPTFGAAPRTVEAYLIDAHGDLYNQSIIVSFIHRLRDQQKFESPETLKHQIAKDVENVKRMLG